MPAKSAFEVKKRSILDELSRPDTQYTDLSPKGSIDKGIRDLIDKINAVDSFVTTSSCAGRLAVYLEGAKGPSGPSNDDESDSAATVSATAGGKGGGKWLYVSHDPLDVAGRLEPTGFVSLMDLFGIMPDGDTPTPSKRSIASYIHLKFEPMILHVLTASIAHAQQVLSAALSAGFRESGISSLGRSASNDATPMVAVRSSGLAFDCIIGYDSGEGERVAMVSEDYLSTIVAIANERFVINTARTRRFAKSLLNNNSAGDNTSQCSKSSTWEPKDLRRQRMQEEGLRRQQGMKSSRDVATPDPTEDGEEGGPSD